MNKFEQAIACNPLAARIGATTINVTKIQEVDDPIKDTFRVILVSGVTVFGSRIQYDEVMEKYLDYLDFTHRKLCNEFFSEPEDTGNAITITT